MSAMHRASSNVRPKPTVAAKAAAAPDAVAADGTVSKCVWAAAVLGIAAAWVAAGSTGLLAHGLRHAITWVLLLLAAALAWPAAARWREKTLLLVGAIAAVLMTVSTLAAVNVLAVSLFVAAFSAAHVGAARAMLLTAAGASGVLALFQIGQSSVASFWQASDAVAGAVGFVGGKLAGQPLNVGSTFAGLDYLVVVFAVLGVLGLDGRLRIGGLVAFGILAVLGHLVYLAVVANSEQIVNAARTARNERLLATYFSPASRTERESLVGPITFKAQGPAAGALEQGASDAALAMQAEEQRRLDRELRELGLTRSEIDEIAAHVLDHADFPESVAPATRTALLDRLKPNLDALEHRELDLPGRRAPYTWDGFVLATVPWNLPALALLFHAALMAVVLWWAFWPSPLVVAAAIAESGSPKGRGSTSVATPLYRDAALPAAVFVLSLLAAGVVTYSPGPGWYEGRKIVAYEKGFLNWLKADYGNMRDNMNFGRLSVGMYGMFGPFVESLGMDFARSKDLAEEDLADADALVMFYPNRRWTRSQVDRIVEFVERGGTLLVAGEHTIHEAKKDGQPQYPDDEAEAQLEDGDEWVGEAAMTSADAPVNRVNDLLEHFGMRIAFDSAEFAVGGWLQSYGAIAHPTTTGLRDERNVFGAVVGASVEAPPPAVPMIIGRYGIGDGGDIKKHDVGSYMGDSRYNAGERLGDIVLAAEKRVGAGRVIVFGDTSSFTNNLTVSSHPYTARLLAYLAAPTAAGPQTAWRQAIAWALLAAALGLLLLDRRPMTLVALAGGLACGIWLFSSMTAAAGEVLPTGQFRERNNVAYIDTSHHGAHSDESLRDDGLMGLTSMLVRHGYLALQMSEFSGERLMDYPEVRDGRYGPSSLKARLVVSIAPQREYSEAECDVMDEYIARGGRLILTVGADDAGPARRLLERFEMRVGAHASPLAYGVPGESSVVASYPPLPGQQPREPTPLGHFKSGYTRVVDDLGEYEPFVRFHAGWPIVCGDPRALVISRYAREEVIDEQGRIRRAEFPLIVIKRHGLGLVAVIGDSGFAMNKNLERIDGLPIEGLRENAFFWRWFLDLLEYEVNRWMPPRQVPAGSELDLQQGQPPASDELDLRKKIEDLLKIPELKISPLKSQGDSNGGTPPGPAETKAKAAEPPEAKDVKSKEKDSDRKSEDRKQERAPRDLRKAGERGEVRGPLLLPPKEKEGEQKDAGASGKEEGK